MFIYILSFLISSLLCLSLLFIAVNFLYKSKKLTVEGKKIKIPPAIGGGIISLSFVISMLLISKYFLLNYPEIIGFLIAGLTILIIGIFDDVFEFSPFVKILGQILAAYILVLSGIITRIAFIPEWANILITIAWIVGIINAFNLLDILDGLASGIAGICALVFLFVSIITKDITAAILASGLAGVSFGFLKYNRHPAKIIMGDSGSMFLGLILAAIAIEISYAPKPGKEIALLTPIIVLGLPIYDIIFVSLIRLIKNKPIFKKSRDHLALRIINKGTSERKTVGLMYLFNLLFCIFAVIILISSNLIGIVALLLLLIICIATGIRLAKIQV